MKIEFPKEFDKEKFNQIFEKKLVKNLILRLCKDNLITNNEFQKIMKKIDETMGKE